ncbi:MAG: zf-HC2 domain-containing protein [Methylococcaceae bacterium]|nr:zf-HC2 domain-containing protein [Methylococcaceae bacterium]
MTTHHSTFNEHAELLGLIPWYVKGSLTPTENEAVRRHLADCEICRREVSNCEALVEHFPPPTENWKPSPAHFAGILAEVDKREAASVKPQASPPLAASLRRVAAWLSQTPVPVRWTLAVETLGLVALALFIALPLPVDPQADRLFETLSEAETPASANGKAIHLMFAEDMTTRELFGLLKQAKAQIRQGPSRVGSYTVEVSAEDMAQSLAILRAHPKVRLAQPVQDSSPDS